MSPQFPSPVDLLATSRSRSSTFYLPTPHLDYWLICAPNWQPCFATLLGRVTFQHSFALDDWFPSPKSPTISPLPADLFTLSCSILGPQQYGSIHHAKLISLHLPAQFADSRICVIPSTTGLSLCYSLEHPLFLIPPSKPYLSFKIHLQVMDGSVTRQNDPLGYLSAMRCYSYGNSHCTFSMMPFQIFPLYGIFLCFENSCRIMYLSHAMYFSGFQLLFPPTLLRGKILSHMSHDVKEIPLGEPVFTFSGPPQGYALTSMFILFHKSWTIIHLLTLINLKMKS